MAEKGDIAERGLEAFAPYLMNRIMRRYNQTLLARMEDLNLSVPKMRAIASLAARDGLTVNELAILSSAEQPTMSRTLDQLEREGLIARTVSPNDSRVRLCSLTETGHEVYRRIWPEMGAAEQAMFADISAEEEKRLLSVLQRMLDNIKQHDI